MKRNVKPGKLRGVKTRDALADLGCAESHLQSLIRRGRIPRPAKDTAGNFDWSEADIAAAREALAEARERRAGRGAA